MYQGYLKHTNIHTIMVKHIHATVDDKVYEELAQAKGKMSWEEFLQKGKEKVEG